MELANDDEHPAGNIAQRYIYTIIGSIHTVTGAVIDTIYDLCARPEYIEPLRGEVLQALEEEGGWKNGTGSRMLMMDSFMKEVQRVNPPSARELPSYLIALLICWQWASNVSLKTPTESRSQMVYISLKAREYAHPRYRISKTRSQNQVHSTGSATTGRDMTLVIQTEASIRRLIKSIYISATANMHVLADSWHPTRSSCLSANSC